MYIKKILIVIAIVGVLAGGVFAFIVYNAVFSPNTAFNNEEAHLYISKEATFKDVLEDITPLLKDPESFISVAQKKQYDTHIKNGHFVITKGMSNNEIIGAIRSKGIPIKVAFNNQERIENMAGRIANQIDIDSLTLLTSITDPEFLKKEGFNEETALSMYIPNSYEVYWSTTADAFRTRMLKEYKVFWNENRLAKAAKLNLTPQEVYTVASIVQKETAKVDERPRVAGVYLNRLKDGIKLDADPTIIYAVKKTKNDWNMVIKQVLFRDLETISPYNTYRNAGVPPGPIFMPDVSSIDAVLSPEKHSYYYFVANVENFGYHKFAKTLAQHNANSAAYRRWINSQGIKREATISH